MSIENQLCNIKKIIEKAGRIVGRGKGSSMHYIKSPISS